MIVLSLFFFQLYPVGFHTTLAMLSGWQMTTQGDILPH